MTATRTGLQPRLHVAVALLLRAAAFGASAGALIAGVAGTLAWPVVGTFFGALVGVVVGAAIGLLDGLVLLGVTRRTRPTWWIRLCSAAVTVAGGLIVSLLTGGHFLSAASPAGDLVLVAVGLLVGGALGPFIALGVEPVALGRRSAPRPLPQVAATFLLRAGLAGAVVGAVAGFVVGVRVYLPTAPAAAIEGAVLGVVSAVVLALLLGAVVVLPRLRARR